MCDDRSSQLLGIISMRIGIVLSWEFGKGIPWICSQLRILHIFWELCAPYTKILNRRLFSIVTVAIYVTGCTHSHEEQPKAETVIDTQIITNESCIFHISDRS